jgi:hypothetical protein
VGLFLMTATPFFLGWPEFLYWGLAGTAGAIFGVWGIVRYFRKSAERPTEDPLDIIRDVARQRRDDYFQKHYESHRLGSRDEKSLQEFIDGLYVWWWRENASGEESS